MSPYSGVILLPGFGLISPIFEYISFFLFDGDKFFACPIILLYIDHGIKMFWVFSLDKLHLQVLFRCGY